MNQIIILAGGQGTRMNSKLPKVLIKLKDKPLIEYLLESVKSSDISNRPMIVVGYESEMVKNKLGGDYEYVLQKEQLGTGHAVGCCKNFVDPEVKNILVLYGDMPFVKPDTINQLVKSHEESEAVLTMMTTEVEDFNDWRECFDSFGRIIRDEQGRVAGIVEKKDATEEQLKIREVNPSYFCFKKEWLWENIEKLKNNNNQEEYYLTDLVKMAIEDGKNIASIKIDPMECLGVNTPEQLKVVEGLV